MLGPLKAVTIAVKEPDPVGVVVRVSVSCVAVEETTVPIAPKFRATVLPEAVVSNPEPAMINVVSVRAWVVVLRVTVGAGTMVATCTAAPLVPPYEVTIAVNAPVLVGFVENVTVSCVVVAAETVPNAPRFAPKVSKTELPAAVVSNPEPAMINVAVELMARLAVLRVTVGVPITITEEAAAEHVLPVST